MNKMKTPTEAEYRYKDIYYKRGDYYAFYYSKDSWRTSASVTNKILSQYGTKII